MGTKGCSFEFQNSSRYSTFRQASGILSASRHMIQPIQGGVLYALKTKLPIDWIGEKFHYYDSIESTNDLALQLAGEGAPHGTLILADEQTQGKGRDGKLWITRPGSALALSLIIRSPDLRVESLHRFVGLGALAVVDALETRDLIPRIKWPNDVLLGGKKTAGILIEGSWEGDQVEYVVVGIGVNVTPESIPGEGRMDYPVTAIEVAMGRPVNREALLLDILKALAEWYPQIESAVFIAHWDSHLAFKGEQVILGDAPSKVVGTLMGLAPDGSLRMKTKMDGVVSARHWSTLRRLRDQPR
jgi:BirA family biotin operon repressor/biotin-[acetyl-CoA-carboxylase] ligase